MALGWSAFGKSWSVMHQHKDDVRYAQYWHFDIVNVAENMRLMHTNRRIQIDTMLGIASHPTCRGCANISLIYPKSVHLVRCMSKYTWTILQRK